MPEFSVPTIVWLDNDARAKLTEIAQRVDAPTEARWRSHARKGIARVHAGRSRTEGAQGDDYPGWKEAGAVLRAEGTARSR
jgi:hypothetical protein